MLGLAAVLAFAFPQTLAPSAPFPLVIAQARDDEPVAPGVARVTYRLQTSAGPLAVHVVVADTNERTVRFDTVLGNDRVASPGELMSSMAKRTHAVAGINGDFYDVGTDGAPIGVAASGGRLLRSPSKRVAFVVGRDRSVRVSAVTMNATVRTNGGVTPLTAVDVYPPDGGASLMTAAYGAPLRASPGTVLATLVRVSDVDGLTGSYRVVAVGPPAGTIPRGPVLALGPVALTALPAPSPGDLVAINADLDPYPLAGLAAAIGGGPRLLANGAYVDDPDAPAPEFRDRREPVTGIGIGGDGSVQLMVVDGRRPAVSVGLTRPEFAALFRALGATEAMGLDGGGSTTLVARLLGDADASVVNTPADGIERQVADGIFVYSDAPTGPPVRLVVRPLRIAALPGAHIALRAALVDASLHRVAATTIAGTTSLGRVASDELIVGSQTGSADVVVRAADPYAALRANIPLDVVPGVARLDIVPVPANPNPGESVRVSARGYDASGRDVALGPVQFTLNGAPVAAGGQLLAPAHSATLVARAGTKSATAPLYVGKRDVPMLFFNDALASAWTFASAPLGLPGSVQVANDTLTLAYDLTDPTARASYAVARLPLPDLATALSLGVTGDGSGVVLRARFRGRDNVLVLRTIGKIDFTGTRRLQVRLDGDLVPPATLTGIYVIPNLTGPPVRASGTLVLHDPRVLVPGA